MESNTNHEMPHIEKKPAGTDRPEADLAKASLAIRPAVLAPQEGNVPVSAPMKVLSTSLGAVLVANLLFSPGLLNDRPAYAEAAQPTLAEWSSEDVKSYFDPAVDWSLPELQDEKEAGAGTGGSGATGAAATGAAANGAVSGTSSTSPTIVYRGGGFGWDDLLLYHLLFNRGGSYSSGAWHRSYPAYDTRTNQPYQPKTYSTGSFQNKQVPGSKVKPKTTVSSGTFSTKSGSKSTGSTTDTKTSGVVPGSAGSGKSTTGSSSGSTSGKSTTGSSSGITSGKSSSSSKSSSTKSGSIGGKSGGFSGSSSGS